MDDWADWMDSGELEHGCARVAQALLLVLGVILAVVVSRLIGAP